MAKQPGIELVDLGLMNVHFDDGQVGQITNWVDEYGNVHDEPIKEPVSVVVKHPTITVKPWYALSVYASEWCVIH